MYWVESCGRWAGSAVWLELFAGGVFGCSDFGSISQSCSPISPLLGRLRTSKRLYDVQGVMGLLTVCMVAVGSRLKNLYTTLNVSSRRRQGFVRNRQNL